MLEWMKYLWGANGYDRVEKTVDFGYPRITYIRWSLHRFWLRRRWQIEDVGVTSDRDFVKSIKMSKDHTYFEE